MKDIQELTKHIAYQLKEITRTLTLTLLDEFNRYPDITIDKELVARRDEENTWPTSLNVRFSRALSYKDVNLDLSFEFINGLAAYNGEPFDYMAKTAAACARGEPDNYCSLTHVGLRFPTINIPKKRTESRYGMRNGRYDYYKSTYWADDYTNISVETRTTIQDLYEKMKEAYKDQYLVALSSSEKFTAKKKIEQEEEAKKK